MSFKRATRALAVSAAAFAISMTGSASADVAGFYKGRTVTIVVPAGLGASLGLYGRLLAEHWGKHIPGNPTVIVQSRPGGGGTKGAAYVYNAAPKDGTTIAEVLAPSVLAPILRNVKFDATRFHWLGSITQRPSVVSVFHTAPATTLEGVKQKEVIMGSTGFGSETYLMPKLMNHLLDTKFKIVKGYKGGASINKAMAQGEVHGRMNYWTGWTTIKNDWLKTGKIKHLIQYGPRIPELPGRAQHRGPGEIGRRAEDDQFHRGLRADRDGFLGGARGAQGPGGGAPNLVYGNDEGPGIPGRRQEAARTGRGDLGRGAGQNRQRGAEGLARSGYEDEGSPSASSRAFKHRGGWGDLPTRRHLRTAGRYRFPTARRVLVTRPSGV